MNVRYLRHFLCGILSLCAVFLITSSPMAQELSDEEKRVKAVAELCGPYEDGLRSGCEAACSAGRPVQESCVQYLRFEGKAQPLITAQSAAGEDAVALEQRALKAGWSAQDARSLRQYVNGVYHWSDPVVDAPETFSDKGKAKFVVELVRSPDGFEIQSGVMSGSKYVSRRQMYELLPTMLEKEFGDANLDAMKVLLLGSRFMMAASDEARALEALERASAIAVRAKVPIEHPYRAEIEARRILVRCVIGWECDITTAETHLANHEVVYGPLNPRTLRLRRLFARALAHSGQEARAREVMLWALRRSQRVLSDVAPETGLAYIDMAEIAMLNGDHIFASGMFGSAIPLIDGYYGENSHAAFRLNYINGLERTKFAIEMAGEGNNKEALDTAQKALEKARSIQRVTFGKGEVWEYRISLALGDVSFARRDVRSALRSTREALSYASKTLGSQHPFTLEAIEQMGRVMLHIKEAKNQEKVATLLNLAREVRRTREDHSTAMIDNTWMLAKAHWGAGDMHQARITSAFALRLAREWLWRQANFSGSGIQTSYGLARMMKLFHETLLIYRDKPAWAFDQVLLWQGLGMQIGRGSNRMRIDAEALIDGDKKGRALVTSWRQHASGEVLLVKEVREEARSFSEREGVYMAKPPEPPKMKALCQALKDHDATLVNYVATIRGGDEAGSKELVYAAFVVNPMTCAPVRIDLGEYHEINASLLAWRAEVEKVQTCYEKRGNALGCLKQMAALDAQAAKLHAEIWAPLELEVKKGGKERVLVVPDGELGALSFEGLVDQDGKYLIETRDLQFIPYPAALLDPKTGDPLPVDRAHKGRKKKGSALVLGDIDYNGEVPEALEALGAWVRCGRKGCDRKMVDVVNTKKLAARVAALTKDGVRGGATHCGRGISWGALQTEALAVAEMLGVRFGDRVTLVTGNAAHEPLVADAMEGPQIIHIATHGFFIDDRECKLEVSRGGLLEAFEYVVAFGGELIDLTRQSGIVLTGASRAGEGVPASEDGLLDGAEIRALDLSGAELISLSACETGLGLAFAGDGVHALMRALIEAGAKRTITSLWQVPSQPTSALFIGFYDKLLHPKKAVVAADALRSAKLKEIEKARAAGVLNNAFLWAGFVLYSAP